MKKKMKTWIGYLLIFSLMVLAVGCGSKEDGKKETPDKTDEIVMDNMVDSTAEMQDNNDAGKQDVAKKDETGDAETNKIEIEDTEKVNSEKTDGDADKESDGLYQLQPEDKAVSRSRYDTHDQMNIYAIEREMPYFIGRSDAAATNYIKNNKDANDGWLYLGLPLYLPDILNSKVAYVEIDNTSVAKIENNEVIGLKQGVFTLKAYDAEKNLMGEKKYVCTTFNDSKSNIDSLMTFGGNLSDYSNARDFDYWKKSVKTIMDMCFCLEARNFVYDFAKEPEMGYLWNLGGNNDVWTWNADPKTIFENSGGVCVQVAQLAVSMLAEDFEDWGAVLIEGNQGHIFNWFYEDGIYYLFDFTEVISDNHNHWNNINYRDYSKKVIKCNSIEEIKEYCLNQKVNLDMNYAIYMYSCKGYDYLPCNVNTGMSDSNAVLNGTFPDETIKIRFQDIVMEDLVVLWENPNANPIEWESVPFDKLIKDVPYYYGTEEYIYRYNY